MTAPRDGGFALPEVADGEPLRLVLVGAGGMGRAWLRTIAANPDVELVGVVDLDVPLARQALTDAGLTAEVGTSAAVVAAATGAHAVVNVTVPGAHHPVTVEALFAGLPVLCEKPIAPTVALALSLAASAEASGRLLMTSQSRRYYGALRRFREQVATLGELGVATTSFFKAPHFGGFREEMRHVLLVDMAIHAFDAARAVLGLDPVAVYCEEFNPAGSWYAHGAAATAVFEFEGGVRYSYTGSWCADGLETSWNGSWRVNGARGTATWDGDGEPVVQLVGEGEGAAAATMATEMAVEPSPEPSPEPEEIAGSLAEFVSSLRTGTVPTTEVHGNVLSLAMVEAAVRSAESGVRVSIASVLEGAYATALADERRADVRAVLEGWGSAAAGLR